MARALAGALEHGGTLERLPGGFWTYPGVRLLDLDHSGFPEWYVNASTVEALIKRGDLIYTKWRQSGGVRLPIAAAVAKSQGDG